MSLKSVLHWVWGVRSVRSITGAVGGALIALAIYHVYDFGAQTFQAYLLPPAGVSESMKREGTDFSAKEVKGDKERRMEARMKALGRQLSITQSMLQGDLRTAAPEGASESSNGQTPIQRIVPILRGIYQQPEDTQDPVQIVPAHAAAPATHNAGDLPNSGPELGLVILAAFGGSVLRRLKMQKATAQ